MSGKTPYADLPDHCYWSRSHVGKVDKQGRFQAELWSSYTRGRLFVSFCFDNGINSADGKKQLMQKSFIEIGYTGKTAKRKFQLPENR